MLFFYIYNFHCETLIIQICCRGKKIIMFCSQLNLQRILKQQPLCSQFQLNVLLLPSLLFLVCCLFFLQFFFHQPMSHPLRVTTDVPSASPVSKARTEVKVRLLELRNHVVFPLDSQVRVTKCDSSLCFHLLLLLS